MSITLSGATLSDSLLILFIIAFMCENSLWDTGITVQYWGIITEHVKLLDWCHPWVYCNCNSIKKCHHFSLMYFTGLWNVFYIYLSEKRCDVPQWKKKKTHLNSKFFNPSSWFCAWTDDACHSDRFEPLGGLWIQGGGNQQCWCRRTQHAIKTDSNQSSRYPLNLLFLFITN